MSRLFGHREHLVRMAGLFAAGIVAFVAARSYFVPKGFGKLGHYRPGALEDNMKRPVSLAGQAACVECHTDVEPVRKGSKHARIRCEACHGALATHVNGGGDPKPARPNPKTLCLTCHTANVAKPKGFPQIEPKDHGDGALCTECHHHHAPEKSPEKSPEKEAKKS